MHTLPGRRSKPTCASAFHKISRFLQEQPRERVRHGNVLDGQDAYHDNQKNPDALSPKGRREPSETKAVEVRLGVDFFVVQGRRPALDELEPLGRVFSHQPLDQVLDRLAVLIG